MGSVFGTQTRNEIRDVYDESTLLQLLGTDQRQKLIQHAQLKRADDNHPIQAVAGRVLLIFDGSIDLYQDNVLIRSIRAHRTGTDTRNSRTSTVTRYSVSEKRPFDNKKVTLTDEILIYWKSENELLCRYAFQVGGEEVILKSLVCTSITVQERTRYLSISIKHLTAKGSKVSPLNALTNSDLIEVLAGIPFFADIPRDKLIALTELSTIRVYPNECVIFREDEGVSTQMFVTLAGSLEVSSSRASAPLAKLEAGSFFGEMSLLINIPRAATVTAMESCMLMSIEKHAFHVFLDKSPEVKASVYKLLKERLLVKALMSGVLPYLNSVLLPRMIEFCSDLIIEDQIHKGDIVGEQDSSDPRFGLLVYGALEITTMQHKWNGVHRDHSVFLTPGCYFGPFTFVRLNCHNGKIYARSPVVLLSCPYDKCQKLLNEFPHVAAEANIAWYGEQCDLASVLRHKVLTERFRGFLEAEHSDENFTFYLDVDKFRDTKDEDRNHLAIYIRERYIQPDSIKEVNLPANIRDTIIERLSKLAPEEIVPTTFFDAAWEEIMRLMTKDSFPRFKKSPLFQNILDTLDPHLNRKGSKLMDACHAFRDSLNVVRPEHVESIAVSRLNQMLTTIRKSQVQHSVIVNGAIMSRIAKVRVES